MRAQSLSATLLALVLNFSYWPGVHAADSFLSDTLIRKGQVQNVLEHQPATRAGCDKTVCIYPLSLRFSVLIKVTFSQRVR